MRTLFPKTFHRLLVVICLAGASLYVTAQDFQQVGAGLTPFAQGWSAMADYDNDGDLDVVLSGIQSNSLGKTTLFQNNNGTFAATGVVLEGLQKGVAQWADYDLDGDYDLLLAGLADDYSRKTILYYNENGIIKPTGIHFPGFANGQAAWFDYDRDGDPDLLISGDTLSLNHFTGLYRNDGSDEFTMVPTNIPNLVSSAMAFADIDNDGDLDIAISGDSGGGDITRLYKNVEGTFVQVNTDLEGVSAGSMAFGDIENDGDMDLFVQGVNFINGTSVFWVYRNDGDDVWTKVSVGLPGLYLGGIALADFDLDGYVDFIATGKGTGCGITATVMYRNNGNGNFWQVGYDFPALASSSVAAGDYDNDGDADLVLTGINGSGNPASYLFRNQAGTNTFAQSLTPGEPMGLSATSTGTSITFRWNRPLSMRGPMEALSYNLRVGTTPGGQEVFSANAGVEGGFVTIPAPGNTQFDTIWTIHGLRDGTYFWSVQAISPGLTASYFAPEQTVDIYTNTEEITSQPVVNPRYDPVTKTLTINTTQHDSDGVVTLVNAAGITVYSAHLVNGSKTHDLHHLTPGLYVAAIAVEGSLTTFKFIR